MRFITGCQHFAAAMPYKAYELIAFPRRVAFSASVRDFSTRLSHTRRDLRRRFRRATGIASSGKRFHYGVYQAADSAILNRIRRSTNAYFTRLLPAY